MAEPFLSEIRMMSFSFPPKGWAFCDGQLLPINQNQGLFSLLGTTFGGNGIVNFALPDLRARTPIHAGNGYTLGERGGEASHVLTMAELPTHTHTLNGNTQNSTSNISTNNVLAAAQIYRPADNLTNLQISSVAYTGGSQAHENRQPFLTISFCIALQGIFPSQT